MSPKQNSPFFLYNADGGTLTIKTNKRYRINKNYKHGVFLCPFIDFIVLMDFIIYYLKESIRIKSNPHGDIANIL